MHALGFLQDLAIVMIVAAVVTIVFHRLKQPVVLGYIIAGFIIGPHTPPFPLVHDEETIKTLAELGVIFLMFGLGLHFSLRKLVAVGATAFIAATLEIVVMLLLGYGIGRAFGWSSMDSIFLGAILSISSTTIIIKALQELGMVKEKFAQLIFGILIVEDILAIAMLALLSSIAMTGELHVGAVVETLARLAIFLASVLVAGLLIVPVLLRYVVRFKSDEMLLVSVLGLCLGVSLLAARLDYSVALGAFLIGAIIAETRQAGRIDTLVAPVRDMFSAVFFVAIGMLIDPALIGAHFWTIVVVTVAVVVGKVVACSVGAFVAGNSMKTSARVGMGLAQIGEFSFIIAQLGVTLKVTSDFLYPVAVAVSAITTLLTPYLIKSSDGLAGWFDRVAPSRLTSHMELYSEWIGRLATGDSTSRQVRKLLRKWVLQMMLNLALVAGIVLAAVSPGARLDALWPDLPAWTGGSRAIIWLGAMLLTLPLLIATGRKLRAAAMLIAEVSVPRAAAGQATSTIRQLITTTIVTLGTAAMVLLVLLLGSAIAPPWPVMVAAGVAITVVAVLNWRSFIRVYSKGQVALADTFNEAPAHDAHHAAVPAAPVHDILQHAALETVRLPSGSPAAGKLIREIQLRSRTGASIVGIQRGAEAIVNPGPDEELQFDDDVLLIGKAEHLAAARKLMGGDGKAE